jgi:hypothetical protein
MASLKIMLEKGFCFCETFLKGVAKQYEAHQYPNNPTPQTTQHLKQPNTPATQLPNTQTTRHLKQPNISNNPHNPTPQQPDTPNNPTPQTSQHPSNTKTQKPST